MKLGKLIILTSALCVGTMNLPGQETNDVEQLKGQLRELQEKFDRSQSEQRQQIEALTRKLDEVLRQQQTRAASTSGPPMAVVAPRDVVIPEESPAAAAMKQPWSPAQPIQFGTAQNYINLSFDGLFAAGGSTANDIDSLQVGGHDPTQRGFTVQNLETVFEGKVDPYFRGQANVVMTIDPGGETIVEAEEVYLETISLPWNLQVKGGQFFTEFGRLNPTHPHAWDFVDQPLVNGRFLGPDGLRNPGVRLSWLVPTPFYSELFFAVQNSQGATATSFRSAGHAHGGEEEEEGLPFGFRHPDNDRGVKSLGDMLFVPRYAVSFDLTDNQVLLLGASAAFGPNSRGGEGSGDTDTQIYGVDLTWKWKSPRHHAGFPFVKVQTEAMLMKTKVGAFDWDEEGNGGDADGDTFVDEGVLVDSGTGLPAVLPGETFTDYGFYSQVLYGFRKGWVAGLRFDYVAGERGDYENLPLIIADGAGGGEPVGRDPLRNRRWRLSPNLTWYPTEFSKFRLQYNYDNRHDLGVDHSIWLQFEFLLGSHAAHKF